MYYLMNKNNIIASFHLETNSRSDIDGHFEIDNIGGTLPYGFDSINNWLENRKSSKHNAHLKIIMKELGCAESTGYIDITHACSINDTFWVKSSIEDTTWEDVSLYKNQW